MSKVAFKRNRVPMGGAFGSLTVEAQCEAGATNARLVVGTGKRKAWLMAPPATSSKRANPTKIGRPAASAEVQVYGRCALIVMSQMDVASSLQFPRFKLA